MQNITSHNIRQNFWKITVSAFVLATLWNSAAIAQPSPPPLPELPPLPSLDGGLPLPPPPVALELEAERRNLPLP